jgi:hypothetical protein
MKPKIREAHLRELAVRASVDPRTIEKAFRGRSVRGMAGHRARAVLKEDGLLPVDDPAPKDA